jgi:PleD family two-component response regulator
MPPTRTGFGSTLVARILPFDLGGEAQVDYEPGGVKARLVVPARHLQPAADTTELQTRIKTQPTARPTLAGRRVLLVEDQILIALDAESCLRSLGAEQVFIAPTAELAMKQIALQPPDLAVLDVNLGDHTSTPVAEALR